MAVPQGNVVVGVPQGGHRGANISSLNTNCAVPGGEPGRTLGAELRRAPRRIPGVGPGGSRKKQICALSTPMTSGLGETAKDSEGPTKEAVVITELGDAAVIFNKETFVVSGTC